MEIRKPLEAACGRSLAETGKNRMASARVIAGTVLLGCLFASQGFAQERTMGQTQQQPPETAGPTTRAATPCDECWAVVNANGTVARGRGVAAASRIDVGTYDVRFANPVSRCSYVASIGHSSTAVSFPGFIVAQRRAGTSNGVYVETGDYQAVYADRSFHVQIEC